MGTDASSEAPASCPARPETVSPRVGESGVRPFLKRPLAVISLVYGAGLISGEYARPPLIVLLGASLALLICALLWRAARPWLLWPLLFWIGLTNLVCRSAIVSPIDLRLSQGDQPAIVSIRGALCATPTERIYVQDEKVSSRSLARIQVSECCPLRKGWQPASGEILVVTPGELPAGFFASQRVEVAGVLAPPPGPVAEGLFDYRAYLRHKGIYYQLKTDSADDWRLLSSGRIPPLSDRFIAWARRTLARDLPQEDEALHLLWAMTLGWTGMPNDFYEPFMRSGTMHIFAISGLHIALIAGLLVSLLRALRVPRFWCGWLVIPLIWFYTGATGWQPSAIRSVIMMTLIIGGWALSRPTDLINSLAAAAFIILVWDPHQLFGASFQLSFFVVLSLGLLAPPIERVRDRWLRHDPLLPEQLVPGWKRGAHKSLRWLTTSLAVSVAAWLGSLPLTANYFHLFSPVTLLANLVIVPLSSCALACNMGSLLCAPWFPWASQLFNHSAWFWMSSMIWMSNWSTALPSAYLYVPAFSWPGLTLYYLALSGALGGWWLAAKRRYWFLAALAFLAGATIWHWQIARRCDTLSILPVNGGFTVFARGQNQTEPLLIDCATTNSVQFTMKPFLRACGVNRLPALALTHGDIRHIGGAQLLAELFRVQTIFASPIRFRSAVYRRTIAAFSENPRMVRSLTRNDLAGSWTVLHPRGDDHFPQADDNALVLDGSFHGTRVLLVSDLGRAGQDALVERTPDLRADILVAGLPSGTEALSESFLDTVRPKVIIVADSEFPASERASATLRERLGRRKATVIYTRFAGAVTLECRHTGWGLRAMNGARLSFQFRPAPP